MHSCILSPAQTAWLPRCPGIAPCNSITSEPVGIKGLPRARDQSTMLALVPWCYFSAWTSRGQILGMGWARSGGWFLSSGRHLMELVVWAFDSCSKERGFQLKKEGQGAQGPAALPPVDDCAERGCCCHQLWLPGFRLNVTSVGRALGMQRLVLSGDMAGSEVPFRAFKS